MFEMPTAIGEPACTAASLGIPRVGNIAVYFIDRHLDEGRGGRVAIECEGERVTYAELAERVNRFGSAIRARLDVRPEERVALLLPDCPAFAYSLFGCIKIAAVPAPLNTSWAADTLRAVLTESGARVLVATSDLLQRLGLRWRDDVPALRHIVVVGERGEAIEFDELLAAGAPTLDAVNVSRDAVALWLYTSGSTGEPKACLHLQHDMRVCAELFGRRVLGLREQDRCLSISKLYFSYGLGNALYYPLSVGATCILSPDSPTAGSVYALIERYRPTVFYWVPAGYQMLLEYRDPAGREFDLSSVRLALSAGEPLPAPTFHGFRQRFGIELLDGIGSTEAMQTFIANRPGRVRPGSSGLLVPGYEARIIDECGADVPPGAIGTLLIKSDASFAGYWNRHESTKRTMLGDWMWTGDRYSRDEDGYFWFHGRSDDMFKVNGHWVSPTDVEQVLRRHPAVGECAVVPRADGNELVKPFAAVVLAPGSAPSPGLATELRQLARSALAPHKVPRWFEFVDALPKTSTGKLQRYRLRESALAAGAGERLSAHQGGAS
jgi:benzoate-CoA ligase